MPGMPGCPGVRDLLRELALLPVEGGARVAIVEGADRMNEDAQNALLKTLEEPPAGVTIVLCADREELLLPTVRSRCARVRLGPVGPREIEASARRPRPGRRVDRRAARPSRRGPARDRASPTPARRRRSRSATRSARTLLDLLAVGRSRDDWPPPGTSSDGPATWPRRSPIAVAAARPARQASADPAARAEDDEESAGRRPGSLAPAERRRAARQLAGDLARSWRATWPLRGWPSRRCRRPSRDPRRRAARGARDGGGAAARRVAGDVPRPARRDRRAGRGQRQPRAGDRRRAPRLARAGSAAA